ncbi:HERC6 [Symbiodinium sp. KB8]|nr:HERC6 [Symbiodinium sp. KB8]
MNEVENENLMQAPRCDVKGTERLVKAVAVCHEEVLSAFEHCAALMEPGRLFAWGLAMGRRRARPTPLLMIGILAACSRKEAERLSRAFLSALSSLAPAVPAACQQRSLAGHGVPCRAVPSGSVCRDGVIVSTQAWLREFVAGEGLCPWALGAKAQIRHCLHGPKSWELCMDDVLGHKLRAWMASDNATAAPTTLTVFSDEGFSGRSGLKHFGRLWRECAAVASKDDLELLAFHPLREDQGPGCRASPLDAGHYSTRAPWPTLQLLRKDDLERARDEWKARHKDSDPGAFGLLLRNKARLRALGNAELAARFADFRGSYGALGIGSWADCFTPTEVWFPEEDAEAQRRVVSVYQVAAGTKHSVALTTTGSARSSRGDTAGTGGLGLARNSYSAEFEPRGADARGRCSHKRLFDPAMSYKNTVSLQDTCAHQSPGRSEIWEVMVRCLRVDSCLGHVRRYAPRMMRWNSSGNAAFCAGCHEAEDDEVELDFSPQPGDGSPLFVPCQQQQTDAGSTGSGRRAEPRGQRFAEAWLRLARIVLLELGTRGPEPPAAVRSSFHAGREAHSRQQALAGPEEVDETAEDASTDWRSDRVCLSYLLEQSVTWIEPESDEDDFHSPKASLQKPPDEEDEEEAHPAMKAIARQQRAPAAVLEGACHPHVLAMPAANSSEQNQQIILKQELDEDVLFEHFLRLRREARWRQELGQGAQPLEDKSGNAAAAISHAQQADTIASHADVVSSRQEEQALSFLENGVVRGGAMPALLEAADRAAGAERIVLLEALEKTARQSDPEISGRLSRFVELKGLELLRKWLSEPEEETNCLRACLVVLRLLPLSRSEVVLLNLAPLAARRAAEHPELREEAALLARTWSNSFHLKGEAARKRKLETEEAATLSEISHLGQMIERQPGPKEEPAESSKEQLVDEHFEDPFA